MKSWNCVHQIMKALFLLLKKPKHKHNDIEDNTSIYWAHNELKILFLCLCSCLCQVWMLCCILLVSISIRESLPSFIPISRRFGTENKAIFHSSHAYTSSCMCCSYPHYHYAHIYGCCAYVVLKLCIKKIYQCIVTSCTFIA